MQVMWRIFVSSGQSMSMVPEIFMLEQKNIVKGRAENFGSNMSIRKSTSDRDSCSGHFLQICHLTKQSNFEELPSKMRELVNREFHPHKKSNTDC